MRLIDNVPIKEPVKLITKHKLAAEKIRIKQGPDKGSLSEYLRRTKSARS
jgi:hypothetical protein